MSIGNVLRFLGFGNAEGEEQLRAILDARARFESLSDSEIGKRAANLATPPPLTETFALAAVAAERLLRLRMFDVQFRGALALHRGHIAEMQTGEGKTLAAVPAIVWYALHRRGVHVLTANDYLAKRDCMWMRDVYSWFGLTVAHLEQGMGVGERGAAYLCDITYATANEVGFDYLRDGLALTPEQVVQRPFAFAVFDEADSLLIDEARIPLVIAGGVPDTCSLVARADAAARAMRRHLHYDVDEFGRSVLLTDGGIAFAEHALGCDNLFDAASLPAITAIQDAIQAHVLFRRDIDYVVRGDSIEIVDEFKGRIAQDRRWPAGLQSALEMKEHVTLKRQGRVLGSITLQNLAAMYERICGMTGTAATQQEEFWKMYKLPVEVIPTNLPMSREDLPDLVFATKEERTRAVLTEIVEVHRTGRPILVGAASVLDSELLSARLKHLGVPHNVLNARNHEAEAAIVAQAGDLGAVTISTNMAGRGTDIVPGGNPPVNRDAVLARGGLYVIGTTRHDARRIDNQLRGRAGRQGDPGTSRFFISLEDDLLVRFGIASNGDIESVQRTAESQNIQARQLLWKYESAGEFQRREVSALRREVLLSPDWDVRSLAPDAQMPEMDPGRLQAAARRTALDVLDDLWADYLANIAELRGGIHWASWTGRDPLFTFLRGARDIYDDFHRCLRDELTEAFAGAEVTAEGDIRFADRQSFERGATWTYLTTDLPFGSFTERILKNIYRRAKGRFKQGELSAGQAAER